MSETSYLDKLKCDTCNRPPESAPSIGVACSGLGAVSFSYCRECAEQGAEPEHMFGYMYDFVADGKLEALHSSCHEMTTWKDGRYWTMREWFSWRHWQWFQPDEYCHWWAFKPHGPLDVNPELGAWPEGTQDRAADDDFKELSDAGN